MDSGTLRSDGGFETGGEVQSIGAGVQALLVCSGIILFAVGITLAFGGLGLADLTGGIDHDDDSADIGPIDDADDAPDEPADDADDDTTDESAGTADDGMADEDPADDGSSDDPPADDDGADDHADGPVEVQTLDATAVDTDRARLAGEIHSLGAYDAVSVHFEWRTMDESAWNHTDPVTVEDAETVDHNLTNLSNATEYEYRVVAEIDDGDRFEGDVIAFSTADDDAAGELSIGTVGTTNVSADAVELTAEVSDLGDHAHAFGYFEWRVEGSDEWNATDQTRLDEPGTYGVNLTGLGNNTTYEFRAIVDADDGTTYGTEVATFTTDDREVIVETHTATNIDTTSATLHGELIDLGGHDDGFVAFEWRSEGADDWNTTGFEQLEDEDAFDVNVTGLTSDTEYEFRGIVETDDGETATGEPQTFITEDEDDDGDDDGSDDDDDDDGDDDDEDEDDDDDDDDDGMFPF